MVLPGLWIKFWSGCFLLVALIPCTSASPSVKCREFLPPRFVVRTKFLCVKSWYRVLHKAGASTSHASSSVLGRGASPSPKARAPGMRPAAEDQTAFSEIPENSPPPVVRVDGPEPCVLSERIHGTKGTRGSRTSSSVAGVRAWACVSGPLAGSALFRPLSSAVFIRSLLPRGLLGDSGEDNLRCVP